MVLSGRSPGHGGGAGVQQPDADGLRTLTQLLQQLTAGTWMDSHGPIRTRTTLDPNRTFNILNKSMTIQEDRSELTRLLKVVKMKRKGLSSHIVSGSFPDLPVLQRLTEVEGEAGVSAALPGLTVSRRTQRGDLDSVRSRLRQLCEELVRVLVHSRHLCGVS